MKKVNIIIKDGKVTADFSGFIGKACEALEAKIRPGEFDIEDKTLKPEYHFNPEGNQTEYEKNEW